MKKKILYIEVIFCVIPSALFLFGMGFQFFLYFFIYMVGSIFTENFSNLLRYDFISAVYLNIIIFGSLLGLIKIIKTSLLVIDGDFYIYKWFDIIYFFLFLQGVIFVYGSFNGFMVVLLFIPLAILFIHMNILLLRAHPKKLSS